MQSHRKILMFALFCLTCATAAPASSKNGAPQSMPTTSTTGKFTGVANETVSIVYLAQPRERLSRLPFFLSKPNEMGFEGAQLGVDDNNTTGRFMGQTFNLKEIRIPADADPLEALRPAIADGTKHILVNLSAKATAALAKADEAQGVLIYDVGTTDDQLRGEECSANMLHFRASRAMRTDALMQFLSKKNWKKIFLVTGSEEADLRYSEALKRSVVRFGLKIVSEKAWRHNFEERRTPESEIPVFTQGVEYDVLVVADEGENFGDLLAYRTWLPRPVAGTSGLTPAGWQVAHEQWGALQLQKRFYEKAKRWMTDTDYAGWLAVRAIGEAALRTKSTDFDKITKFMIGPEFALAGFKGVPLSFRSWDGQLRQPVLLATERSLVGVAPIEGFQHQHNELDTLGFDQHESKCHHPLARQ